MKAKKKPARAAKKITPVAKAAAPARSTANAMTAGTPFQMLLAVYGGFVLTHLLIVYVANMIAPTAVVLGTHLLNPFMALLNSMVVFTFVTVAAIPVIENIAMAMKMKLSNMHWMVAYFAINFVGLWAVSRFAEQLGFGVASWMVVAALALVMDIAQGLVYQVIGNSMK